MTGTPIHREFEQRIKELTREPGERKRVGGAIQEAEEKYRALFDESKDAIYISSRDGKFLDVNRALLELLGYSREEMIDKLDVREIYVYPGKRDTFQQEIEKKGSVRDYEVKFKKKNVVFSVFGRRSNLETEYVILGEEILLEMMFANLMKNGIEASPEGGTMSVSIDTAGEPGKAFHVIDIHNMGVVPLEIRERFFEPYTTQGKKGGTGLGTHNALLIARTHKGDITFTTSEQEGSHVTVRLPEKLA